MSAFFDPQQFPFVAELERSFEELAREVNGLDRSCYLESADSLTTLRGHYNETGWRYFDLHGDGDFGEQRAQLPKTSAACLRVPELVNAGLSLFEPGTHLYPHHGEMQGVLRCHLPLVVPPGDQGIRIGSETMTWQAGRCLVFDDTFEHEAWNHTEADRIVLIVTFRSEFGGRGLGLRDSS